MEKYQTVILRSAAILFDTAIFVCIIYVYERYFLDKTASKTIAVLWSLVTLISVNFYNIYLTYRYGQTLGKMLLKVKVVDISENSLTLYQAILRRLIVVLSDSIQTITNFYFILTYGSNTKLSAIAVYRYVVYCSFLIYFIEFIVMLSNSKHRSLDDYIAGTVVIRTN